MGGVLLVGVRSRSALGGFSARWDEVDEEEEVVSKADIKTIIKEEISIKETIEEEIEDLEEEEVEEDIIIEEEISTI